MVSSLAIVLVQLLSRVRLSVTLWTAACQSSLSFTISRNLLPLVSIESVMPSNHLIICCPLLLLPSNLSQHQGLFQCILDPVLPRERGRTGLISSWYKDTESLETLRELLNFPKQSPECFLGASMLSIILPQTLQGENLFILEPYPLTSSLTVKMSDSVDSQHMCSRLRALQMNSWKCLQTSVAPGRHPHHQKAFIQYLPVPFTIFQRKEFIFKGWTDHFPWLSH